MDSFLHESISRVEDNHWWFVGRRVIIKSVLDIFFKRNGSKKILEIGCGSGGNLNLLSEYGLLSAMEMDDDSRKIAKDRGVCEVTYGKVPSDILLSDKFDLICMFDVLEHIKDDHLALSYLSKALKVNGLLIISVPAYNFLWSKHDEINKHERRYTKKSLLSLASGLNYEIKYLSYFNMFLFPVFLLFRLVEKYFFRNKSLSMGVDIPNKFINTVLNKIFSSEKIFIPKLSLPFGSSIVMVLSKKTDD